MRFRTPTATLTSVNRHSCCCPVCVAAQGWILAGWSWRFLRIDRLQMITGVRWIQKEVTLTRWIGASSECRSDPTQNVPPWYPHHAPIRRIAQRRSVVRVVRHRVTYHAGAPQDGEVETDIAPCCTTCAGVIVATDPVLLSRGFSDRTAYDVSKTSQQEHWGLPP